MKKAIEKRFWSHVAIGHPGECWPWTGSTNSGGYGQFRVDGMPVGAHRYAFFLAGGIIHEKYFVCHRCDNPPCVNPAHLFLGTAQDNSDDCVRKGRKARGDGHPVAKLSKEDVRKIFELRCSGMKHYAIAERFQVTRSNICLILGRKRWAWLPINTSAGG